jgi:hypothetical protein
MIDEEKSALQHALFFSCRQIPPIHSGFAVAPMGLMTDY